MQTNSLNLPTNASNVTMPTIAMTSSQRKRKRETELLHTRIDVLENVLENNIETMKKHLKALKDSVVESTALPVTPAPSLFRDVVPMLNRIKQSPMSFRTDCMMNAFLNSVWRSQATPADSLKIPTQVLEAIRGYRLLRTPGSLHVSYRKQVSGKWEVKCVRSVTTLNGYSRQEDLNPKDYPQVANWLEMPEQDSVREMIVVYDVVTYHLSVLNRTPIILDTVGMKTVDS